MRRTAGGSYRLVLLRHGQSEWNARNPYTGWVNVPLTEAGEREAVPAGGNTLRALVKHLDAMPEERVAELDIPTGVPLAYELRPDMRPVVTGGRYLGPAPVAARKQPGGGEAQTAAAAGRMARVSGPPGRAGRRGGSPCVRCCPARGRPGRCALASPSR